MVEAGANFTAQRRFAGQRCVHAFKNENQGRSWVAISGAVDDSKVSLIVEISSDLVQTLRADHLMKRLLPLIDGRGGGKPQRAEAGGKYPDRIGELYKEGLKAVREALEG